MAKNYTFAEIVEVICEGKDLEQLQDIGRRYPLAAIRVAQCAAIAGDHFLELMKVMPVHLTANKVNGALKALIPNEGSDIEDEEQDEEVAEKPVAKRATKVVETSDDDYSNMTGGKLFEVLKEKGLAKACKEKMGDVKKQSMIDFLNSLDATQADDAEEAEEEVEEQNENGKYDGMSSIELFKECKARKIKAAPKKPSKFYIDLLEADDAKAVEVEEEEDDDWGDEEEVATPKPAAKKAEKPKVEEPAEDDDDDWDI